MDMKWTDQTSLYYMQKDIEKIIVNRMGNNVYLTDVISMEFNDYVLLERKIMNICSADDIDRYSLAMIVACVCSNKHGRYKEFINLIKNIIKKLPQHHTKYVLECITSTFYDYQIDNFGYNMNCYEDIEKVMQKHLL